MKVLLTATVQSHICQFHRPLVEMLHAHGCEVHVAAKDNLAEKNGLKLDFVEKVFDVPFNRSPKSPENIKAYKQLKKIIDEGSYDVIHCNTPVGGVVTRLAAAKARKNGAKVYYTAHGFHFYKGAPFKNWLVFYPIEKFFANYHSDKLITINYEDYELAKSKFKCPTYHIDGVGVDDKRYRTVTREIKQKTRSKLNIDSTSFVLLCVGELNLNKNQTMVLKAIQKLLDEFPNIMLLIAGNGPQKDAIEEYINKNLLKSNVKLLGYCTNLEEYQVAADVCVSCSVREGLGLNLIEAMLSGNPVIATRNRGHNELIHDGENGFLVEINDVDAMADRIRTLSNTFLYETMSRMSVTSVQEYTAQNVMKELELIYKFKIH